MKKVAKSFFAAISMLTLPTPPLWLQVDASALQGMRDELRSEIAQASRDAENALAAMEPRTGIANMQVCYIIFRVAYTAVTWCSHHADANQGGTDG